jgi:predicted signal transduction protein with EAL and GGDEF domain
MRLVRRMASWLAPAGPETIRVELEAESVMVRASLGFALFPRDGNTTAALLAAADDALYAHKREQRPDPGDAHAAASAERRRHRTS